MPSHHSSQQQQPPPPAPRSVTGMLQRTGAAEGYYRRNYWQQEDEQQQPENTAAAAASTANTIIGASVSTSPGTIQRRRSLSAPVQPETMKDRTVDAGIRSGFHPESGGALRPPGELGVKQTTNAAAATPQSSSKKTNNNGAAEQAQQQQQHQMRAHPGTVAARQRLQAAVKRGRDVEAQQQQNDHHPMESKTETTTGSPASLVASFCYRGMEVLVATTDEPMAAYCMCARTRLVFQRLQLSAPSVIISAANDDDGNKNGVSILSLQSHAATGQICVALSTGIVQTFHPVPTDPKEVCFGKYRWLPGPVFDCARTFYDEGDTASFVGAFHNDAMEGRLDVSLAGNGKVLVAHHDQLAVFDGLPAAAIPTRSTTFGATMTTPLPSPPHPQADLLWTTQLPGQVVTAKISGDGQSIAVVLKRERSETEDEEDAKAATDGVHTFERDMDDGSQVFTTVRDLPTDRPSLNRVQSLGILYKPGPFLVHSARVTRLSFRGYGNVTSNVREGQGNDLLLTFCASDCSARIYCQNNWNPLTEWTAPSCTRVDWVKCISTFSLGDLESFKRPNKKSSTRGPPSRLLSDDGTDIHESLGKRLHFSSIPNQPAASTNAGAWVVEVTFQDPYPALRLSRLTYLARGVDDLNPTLLESVSSFLPVNCVFRDRILASDESGFSVEGVWPAWNPWLSESTELNTTETLAGSAMAFLGLSSGPAAGVTGGGYFGGGGSLGGTQSPPSELRIVSSHTVSGQVVVLEFPVLGDNALTSLELGNPIRSVLSVSHMNNCVVASSLGKGTPGIKRTRKARVHSSMCYDSSRLIAEVQDDARSVSIIWRKPGTMSFLPYNWLADDADPPRAAALLKNSASTLRDESLIPLPLVLPSVCIPGDIFTKDESICVILWWPDSKFSGSPLLVAVLTNGTVVVFEIPPPWSSLEPPLPNYGKPPPTAMSFDMHGLTPSHSFDDGADDDDQSGREYEVAIMPDPEYGLGLRLESQADGMCAVAGSFKRHPLNGEVLPAEKSGMIHLGDELLSANDVDLEDEPFEDIVTAVREVGSACSPGNPIRMKFRRPTERFERHSSFGSGSASQRRQENHALNSPSQKRRTMEQMLGVTPDDVARAGTGASSRASNNRKGHHTHGSMSGRMIPTQVMAAASSIAGVFPEAVSVGKKSLASYDLESTFMLIPYAPADEQHVASEHGPRSSLLFWSEETSIVVTLLSVSPDCEKEKAERAVLGKYRMSSVSSSAPDNCVCALHVVDAGLSGYTIVVGCQDGHVHLVTMTMKASANLWESELSFQSYSIFCLKNPWSSGSVLRAYSTDLLATMQPDVEGTSNTISIWSASPRPGGPLVDTGLSTDDEVSAEYYSTEVSTEYCSDGNTFFDFCFLRSGFLDASPSLVTLSLKGAAMFLKQGGSSDWMPAAQISYSAKSWLEATASPSLSYVSEHCFTEIYDYPGDIFPHLVSGLCSVFTSRDEATFLRSDWHPDSLLAYICTHSHGTKTALKDGVRVLFLWLCSECRDIPEGHLGGSLPVAPFSIFDEHTNTPETSNQSESVMAALTASRVPESSETSMLRDLQSAILDYISIVNSTTQRPGALLPMGAYSAGVENRIERVDLPHVLRAMEADDLRLLWALGEVALSPPRFETLDRPAQLFLFSSALFGKAIEVTKQTAQQRSTSRAMPAHGTVMRRISSTRDLGVEPLESVASAGALGALLSSNQVQLLQSSRIPDQRMTWSFAREHRVAFWERSDITLARLSEEIGQSIFRETRDSMECALFFVIARKIKTLRNLSATDQSETGSTFFKFLTNHDFSSERGRRAAEKNAFSLLRKCRYRAAASFFLLASPPFLNSALETISTKMHDLDLAFLVARLMESPDLGAGAESLSVASSFGGVFGGGGGYAELGTSLETNFHGAAEAKFSDWKPKLGHETHKLLVDRILPATTHDNAMTAVSLLWLGKKEEAAWFLSGNVDAKHAGVTTYSEVDDVAQRFFDSFLKTRQYSGTVRLSPSPVVKANALIDFASSMALLESLRASSRVRLAASLGVSRALSARGAELSSIRALVDFSETFGLEDIENMTVSDDAFGDSEDPTRSNISGRNGVVETHQPGSGPQSSIFDAFDATQLSQKANPQSSAADDMQSSIFDDFSGPSGQKKELPAIPPNNVGAGDMHSSIFDDFDAPPESVRKASPSVSQPSTSPGDIQSSVFADFDGPPHMQKTKPTTSAPHSSASGAMQSSIFDDYDVPPPIRKSTPAVLPLIASSVNVQSSAFDGFDVPGQGAVDTPVPKSADTDKHLDQSKVQVCLVIKKRPTSRLWLEWRKTFLLDAVARRLLREIASVIDKLHGDPVASPIHDFYLLNDLLLSPCVSEILQLPCDSERILGRIKQSLQELCCFGKLDSLSCVNRAIHFLGPSSNHRILYSVALYVAIGRADLAEDIVRFAANSLIQRCRDFSFSHDDLVHKKQTRAYVSSQFTRREAARLSWQLESCLWLHRGGGFALSGSAFNEAIVAVRIGLLLASWNRNFECLEAMIQTEPDCMTDLDAGRHLWTSLKVADSSKMDLAAKKTSSGGWEFLVDCKRSQATELLRERSTGCFIIRPHAEDHGVFTLSFKTNLVPAASAPPEENGRESESRTPDTSGDELAEMDISNRPPRLLKKKVRKDDVVQHAIIRLSDSGFRCGSFGPFASLITLLEAVSSSLPFKLRFDLPPRNRVIKEEGSQTSPNAVLLRKLSLRKADSLATNPPTMVEPGHEIDFELYDCGRCDEVSSGDVASHSEQMTSFGLFAQLVVLCLVRRQLSSVATFVYEDHIGDLDETEQMEQDSGSAGGQSHDSVGDVNSSQFAVGSRILGPLLTWCRSIEVATVPELSPEFRRVSKSVLPLQDNVTESSDNVTEWADAIEVSAIHAERYIEGGDSILRGMIQLGSGVEFSTLRLVDAGECTMLVLFSRQEAVRWLVSSGIEQTNDTAVARLEKMEKDRVIEPVDLSLLPLKQKTVPLYAGVRYRFVDPWEVEALSNREGETRSASLGRGRFVGFSLGQVALTTDRIFRALGGVPLLELWVSAKGGIALTKALAAAHPPWERAASGDLQLTKGKVTEPPPLINSIRRCLYRNTLYRRLNLPQRFLALVQVELLDLKNLTTPGGSLSLTVYALLRLKRAGTGGTLTNKARTLDSAATVPMKLNKTSGPNAPASWGSVVRFRFPLPEDASVDGTSYDRDRESLFKGPPRVLQVSVYEKKLLADHSLGTADISTDGLGAGGQLEEWVPLRSEKRGITWFARIRLTLRFELMCLAPERQMNKESVPSVGLQRINELSHSGGSAHEAIQKRSMSSPDLMSYFEGIVY